MHTIEVTIEQNSDAREVNIIQQKTPFLMLPAYATNPTWLCTSICTIMRVMIDFLSPTRFLHTWYIPLQSIHPEWILCT